MMRTRGAWTRRGGGAAAPRASGPVAGTAGAVALCLLAAACAAPEPTVVVYVSGAPEVVDWIVDEFRSAHPEETLQVEGQRGARVLDLLRGGGAGTAAGEGSGSDTPTTPDVWLGAPSWLLAEAAAEGLLAGMAPSWAAMVPADMRDPRGRWVGWVADPMVLAFNPDRTSRGRAPMDWIDVFHPRWSGDVLLPVARNSHAMEAFIGTVVSGMALDDGNDDPGFDWLARLDANRKDYVVGSDELVRRLAGGEASLALLSLSQSQTAKEGGLSVDFRIPESGSPTLVLGVAVVAGGAHQAGAATFIEWLGTPAVRNAVARRFRVLPATSGAEEGEPAWVTELRPLLRMEVAPADTLATHLEGWLERWRGKVMGRTPVVF